MQYNLDKVEYKHGKVHLIGWAVPAKKENVIDILVRTKEKKEIPSTITKIERPDVGEAFFQDNKADSFGFDIWVNIGEEEKVFVTFREVSHVTGKPIDSLTIRFLKSVLRIEKALERRNILSAIRCLKDRNIKEMVQVLKRDNRDQYEKWLSENKLTKKEWKRQVSCHFEIEPKFSIIVPAYNTPLNFLKDMIESVQKQSYKNWELCIANGSKDNIELVNILEKYVKKDARIKVVHLEENKGISGNTNAALALADGDFIALLDHDDTLALNALYEYVVALNVNPEIDFIYSDEDNMDMEGKYYFTPYFKSDLNLELLRCNNYICHFVAIRKTVMDEIGGFRSEYDGAQDHDVVLRSVELAREVYHCPKILYHWRSHENSTAGNPETKMYAFEAGKRAIQAHFDRLGMDVKTELGERLGWYRNHFNLSYHPLVSIIIPNKDHREDLEKCLHSIYTKSTYDNYEVIVVENNSTEQETFAYYETAKEKYQNLKIVTWDGPFNYSAINNFGETFAKGEYLLLLNNDIEVITPDFLEKMLGYCMQEKTAIVGAQLYFEDDTIQHAGIMVGLDDFAGPVFTKIKRGKPVYKGNNLLAQNLSAVTAACMLVRRSVFEEVNGLDESFAIALNDVDFCLRVREAGYYIVYQPDAELYHYESKSRGYETTPEKKQRFDEECARFGERWKDFLDKGDPYYNINLSLYTPDYEHYRTKDDKKWH